MTDRERQEILAKAKVFFMETIVVNHKKNTEKLKKLSAFDINPFLIKYLASYAYGDSSPESVAKALVYPRVMGTSITTSFGTNMQRFCNAVLSGYASIVSGIDIEFEDALDARRKYCQIKAGPQTINKDDVDSILGHFTAIKNLARTNQKTDLNPSIDCVVGVLYGTFGDLSQHYKKVHASYPVICGQDFWHRLTGDAGFYGALSNTFAEAAIDVDGRELIDETVRELAKAIAASGLL